MDKNAGYMEANLGGQIRPLKFGMGAWKIISEQTGLSLDKMGEIPPSDFPALIIFAGAKQAALADNKQVDFNINNVYDWLDEITPELLEQIIKCLGESKLMGRTFNDFLSGSVKKKEMKAV